MEVGVACSPIADFQPAAFRPVKNPALTGWAIECRAFGPKPWCGVSAVTTNRSFTSTSNAEEPTATLPIFTFPHKVTLCPRTGRCPPVRSLHSPAASPCTGDARAR